MLQKQQNVGEDVSAGFHYDTAYSTEQFIMAEAHSDLDAHQQCRISSNQDAGYVHSSILKVEDMGSSPNKCFWYGTSVKASSHSCARLLGIQCSKFWGLEHEGFL